MGYLLGLYLTPWLIVTGSLDAPPSKPVETCQVIEITDRHRARRRRKILRRLSLGY
jgi:hypothetical protein